LAQDFSEGRAGQ